MQIKITLGLHLTPVTIASAGEDVEKNELLYTIE
jgi:hypothetical protein